MMTLELLIKVLLSNTVMFEVQFSSKAKKEFDQLKNLRVEETLTMLKIDPIPAKRYDVKKMRGVKDTFRIRIGDIRIVYTILWKVKIILIARIGDRKNVYD